MATYTGTSGNDTFTGGSENDSANGFAGNDTLMGGDGNDSLIGDAGNDILTGGDGNDTMLGGAGSDVFNAGVGSDFIDGGQVVDRVGFSDFNRLDYRGLAGMGVVINLAGISGDGSVGMGSVLKGAAGVGGTDTVANVNIVVGTHQNDSIVGSSAGILESFVATRGIDTIDGGAIDAVLLPNNFNVLEFFTDTASGVVVDLLAGTMTKTDGSATLRNINWVFGSDFNDQILGSDDTVRAEQFDGRAGNDTIDGRGGFDIVRYDRVTGFGLNLRLDVTTPQADGTGSQDVLLNVEGLIGSAQGDTFFGNEQANRLEGMAGNDTMAGLAGHDTLIGGAGNDILSGDDGNDSASGGVGSDTLNGNTGNDVLDGGVITDRVNYVDLNWLDYRSLSGMGVNLNLSGISGDGSVGTGTVAKGVAGVGGTDTVSNVNWIVGTHQDDSMVGSSAAIFESFFATRGTDTLDGGAMDATLFATNGNRLQFADATGGVVIDLREGTLTSTDRSATVRNFDQVRASPFDDQLLGSDDPIHAEQFDGRGGNDTVDGRGGFDIVRYDQVTGVGVSVRLGINTPQDDGTGGQDVLRNIEGLLGSPQADNFIGDALANRLDGRDGNDTVEGGLGNDSLFGGAGADLASYANASAAVSANLALGAASGGDGVDSLSAIEGLLGSAHNDTLIGSTGSNTLMGGAGNDSMFGAEGQDTLEGGAGDDTLDGGIRTDLFFNNDANWARYSNSPAAITVNLSGITGIGRTGQGTAQDGHGGTDVLRNISYVRGSAHDDRITGSTALQFEIFNGGLGDDTIDGGVLADRLGRDTNRVQYDDAPAAVNVNFAGTATGGAGADSLLNINGVTGSAHNDTLVGTDRTDVTEQYAGIAGNDSIVGRGGFDIVRYDFGTTSTGANINLTTGTATDGFGGTDTFSGIEGAFGSDLADTITGSNNAVDTEFFDGQGGNDTIDGREGMDRVSFESATAGANVTLGGTSANGSATDGQGGTDTLISIEAVRGSPFADTITGSDTNTFETFEGLPGNDTIDGRGGSDQADYFRGRDRGAVVSLELGQASEDGHGGVDTLLNIEHLRGTFLFGDSLTGNAGANSIDGSGGNDTLSGGGGSDTVVPGTGVDVVDGGAGSDALVLVGARAAYTLSQPAAGTVRLVNAATNEEVSFTNVEIVAFSDQTLSVGSLVGTGNTASPFDDTLTGTASGDTLDGGAGNDSITGLGGNDSLQGGTGDDTIAAGQPELPGGQDLVDGGSGRDTLRMNSATNQYGFTEQGDGSMLIVNGNTGERVIARNIEYIEFTDGTRLLGAPFTNTSSIGATAYADSIGGTTGSDNYSALAGDDTLNGGDGNDTLRGAAGDDVLSGDAGTDVADYGDAPGAVVVNLLAGAASGAAGNDVLSGFEAINGGASNDSLTGNTGANTLKGAAGNDTLNGGAGNDRLEGGDGDDVLADAVGQETFLPGIGNDTITGTTVVDIGSDGDFLNYGDLSVNTGTVGLVIDLSGITGNATTGSGTVRKGVNGSLGTDTVSNIPFFQLSPGDDSVLGSAAARFEQFNTNTGNDTIDGGVIDATLFPSNTNRITFSGFTSGLTIDFALGTATGGGAGYGSKTFTRINDTRGSDFADQIFGSDQTVYVERFDGGTGGTNDTIDGRGGFDMIITNSATTGLNANLATGVLLDGNGGTDTLLNIEAVQGHATAADTLVGNDGDNRFEGRGGNDVIDGGGGNDTLFGGAGVDTLQGGAGTDVLDYSQSGSAVSVNLLSGAVSGGEGADVISGIENVIGSTGNDTITGDNTANVLSGRDGTDSLVGGAGDDSLFGGAIAVDVIATSLGLDTLRGDAGNDTLDGGAIRDRINSLDSNVASYVEDPAGIRLDLSAVTGDGNSGFGTVIDGWGNTDRLISINFLNATSFADTIIGSSALVFEQFDGRAGDDTIDGGAITDRVFNRNANRVSYDSAPAAVSVDLGAGRATGGAGTDTLININHIFASPHNDTLTGSNRSDFHEQFEGRSGNDTIDGRGGEDVARYTFSPSAAVVNLVTGVAQDGWGFVDTLLNIEGARGSAFDDVLIGGNAANGTTAGGARTDGLERFAGLAGDDTIDGGQGFDRAEYMTSTAGVVARLGGIDDLEQPLPGTAQDGLGGTDTLISVEALLGSMFADGLSGSNGLYETFNGRGGNDSIDGGAGIDMVDYRNDENQVVVNLATGTATDGFGNQDQLANVEIVFGSLFADQISGRNSAANLRDDTFRGGEGNDTLDGGTGVDTAEWLGNRADYVVTQVNASTWTVRDNNLANGDDGTDTVSNIERFVFADQMLTFGSRAEELARVATVLWGPGILGSSALFCRGFSFYDSGHTFELMSRVALQFFSDVGDAALAAQLKANSGTSKTVEQLLATFAANGGDVLGRAAMVREAALDAGTTATIETNGMRTNGLASDLFARDFGQLFDLWPSS